MRGEESGSKCKIIQHDICKITPQIPKNTRMWSVNSKTITGILTAVFMFEGLEKID